SIDAMVTDIDAARGVACRAIADDLGSRTMIDSEQWRSMREAGVLLAAASRSYYADPLAAGANIFGCRSGLLHSKTLTLDGEVTRFREHGSPQFRARLREQHPFARPR
ncbi:MAG: hypothetical protein WBM63_16860, partial [Sedimenticolaceae bacterium]